MPVRIVRNDITKMQCDAIVNTANPQMVVGPGCDTAIYKAAGWEELLAYRREHVGEAEEGDVFITPGFNLPARFIIHAVSPRYIDGESGEESKLRRCYKMSLDFAFASGLKSIAFPLISAGSFGYPKEEAMRIALDEINAFLVYYEMDVTLVVFGDGTTALGEKLYPDLESYIDQNYVQEKMVEEYGGVSERTPTRRRTSMARYLESEPQAFERYAIRDESIADEDDEEDFFFDRRCQTSLDNRLIHNLKDSFSTYLLYLIESKGMTNEEVYKRACVDKKVFSKIKNNSDYHPQKLTALCLCVGAKLNMDETIDLLARAGYALSPCDMTDIIFSYFIEKGFYDVIEIDIQLEEHGLKCIIK